VDHDLAPEPDPLTRLRAAAAAVSDLDVPGDGAQDDPGLAGHATEATALDAGAHADRFSELHESLVAVLADVDRG
jgi:hypothetical protein